jgi:hypothetical protein
LSGHIAGIVRIINSHKISAGIFERTVGEVGVVGRTVLKSVSKESVKGCRLDLSGS